MQRPEGRFNGKRRMCSLSHAADWNSRLNELASAVQYGGNPEHKRVAGDFGLDPPSAARRGKTLCDTVGIFRRAEALDLLAAGLRRGLVDGRWDGQGWPKNIWAVATCGVPVEAQREAEGMYHGYPLSDADPFWHEVVERWSGKK